MADVQLIRDARGYVLAALQGFFRQGWQASYLPARGRLRRNQQIVELEYGGARESYRLIIYKVGQSGRRKGHERRIEITSTYFGGRLAMEPTSTDVLLGYEPDEAVFVGFDTRRLEHGGETENASAFIDIEGLRLASDTEITVVPRDSALFGIEYHAFFKASRMAEYVTNRLLIHAGAYKGAGTFSETFPQRRQSAVRVPALRASGGSVVLNPPASGGRPRTVRATDVEAVETGRVARLRSRKISPERFQELLRQAEENGALGEQIAIESERRRLRLGRRADLALQVRWTSRENVAAGYDISSFELDGFPRFIEAKATVGSVRRFVITPNEWRTAEALRDKYWIYLITGVRDDPQVSRLQDPVAWESSGRLHREADAWVVTVKK